MNCIKRVVIVILTIAITLSFMPSMAFADNESSGTNTTETETVTDIIEEEQSVFIVDEIAETPNDYNAAQTTEVQDDSSNGENVTEEAAPAIDEISNEEVTEPVDGTEANDLDVTQDEEVPQTEQGSITFDLGSSGENPLYPVCKYSSDGAETLYPAGSTDPNKISQFSFTGTLKNNEVVFATFFITAWPSSSAKKGDIEFRVYNGNNKLVKRSTVYGEVNAAFAIDRKELKTDNFRIEMENRSSKTEYGADGSISIFKSYASSVKLPKEVKLQVKKSKTLNLSSGSPESCLDYAYRWVSSNTKIATVDNEGTVKAKSKGTCYVTAYALGGLTAKCKVTVTIPPTTLNYTKAYMNKGHKVKLKLLNNKKKVKWSTSNKKIATVSKKGTVTAKKVGQCTITAKVGKKKYKCKVYVKYRVCDFGAVLWDYNTRGNYFVVKFRNRGSKPLTITSGIKVEDVDYKSYDRKVKLKKKIKIKPKSTKFVRFYVKGKNTWPEYDDFTLFYKFSYDGKTYEGHVWDEDSVYKNGKKWYYSYLNENWYYDWAGIDYDDWDDDDDEDW